MARYKVLIGWDDIPHLDEAAKAELLKKIPPYQRRARTAGIPEIGPGAIYPIDDGNLIITDFEVPKHWPRAYALDVGWNITAALWGALDRETDTLYLYSEHYLSEAQPLLHAEAIKARGTWIPGVIDPTANGRNQADGTKLLETYRRLGLDLQPANNAVQAGLTEVWIRMSSGRLKVFTSLGNWTKEKRLYRRDEKGRIVKKDDHLMDCMRYLVMSGLQRMRLIPGTETQRNIQRAPHRGTWMG